ncbi:MAG: hypothetical protein V1773_04655 [bacterium]
MVLGTFFIISITIINLLRYRSFLSKRFKLKFWIELALITTLAGFFMGGFKQSGWQFSIINLEAGFQITLRALLMTECFALIGIEFMNPKIKKFFIKAGFTNLQAALETAFHALPLMLAILSTHKAKLKTPSVLISGYLTYVDEWILNISKPLSTNE